MVTPFIPVIGKKWGKLALWRKIRKSVFVPLFYVGEEEKCGQTRTASKRKTSIFFDKKI